MSNYRKIREETLRIELIREFFNHELPSIEYATEYIYKGLETINRTYKGLALDTPTINHFIYDVRNIFISSGITYFLKRDVLVSIIFEVGGNIRISFDISEE